MRFLSIAAVVVVAFQLVACGNIQSIKKPDVPVAVKGSNLRLTAVRPDADAVFRAHAVPGKSVYVRQNTGGSAAVGILLGPLGAAINANNIENRNKALAESGKASTFYQIDALSEAAQAFGMEPQDVAPGAASGDALVLQPRLVLFGGDDQKTLYSVAVVRADKKVTGPQGEPKPWTAYYYYVVEPTYPLEKLQGALSDDEKARYIASVRAGFQGIKAEIQRDLTGNLPVMKIANVTSPALGAEHFMFGAIGVYGDIEQSPEGRLVVRVPMYSSGGDWARWASHVVWVFPQRDQYVFGQGPVDREQPK